MQKWILKSKNILELAYLHLSKFISSQFFLFLCFVWFLFQAAYIALSTRFGIPPDEKYHFEFISHIAANHWLPFFGQQVNNFQLGESSRNPFFIYHYLFSFPFRLFEDYEYSYLILRFLNILIAICSLFLVVKIANLLSINKLARNISIFMLTNTLMFIFLSASINYDNLFVLTSLLSIYLLVSLLKKPDSFRFLLLVSILAFGIFIKISFIPIAVAVAVIFVVGLRKKLKMLIGQTLEEIKKLNLKYLLVLILLLAFCSLITQRYLVNIVQYERIEPRCMQVLTFEECKQNALFVRTQMIQNSDRPEATRPIYEFVFDWSLLMQERVYGIFAHKTTNPTKLIFIGSQILLIITVVAAVRKYNIKDKNIGALLALIIFYFLILAYNNHGSYEKSGNFGFASQGRYLFAVLPLVYLLGNHYILKLFKSNALKLFFVLGILLVFITAGLPSYIYTTDPSWHSSSTLILNSELKELLYKLKF